jgi:hypothetical protein
VREAVIWRDEAIAEAALPKEDPPTPAVAADVILQVKVSQLGISPMVWRRVPVPATCSLRELHGAIQVATGWEGIHLFQFHLRAVCLWVEGTADVLAGRDAGGVAVSQGSAISLVERI